MNILFFSINSFIHPSFHSLYLPAPRSLLIRLSVDLFIRIPAPVLGSGETGVGCGWGLRDVLADRGWRGGRDGYLDSICARSDGEVKERCGKCAIVVRLPPSRCSLS